MKTPIESWQDYRDFVYAAELDESYENERKRAFFAGAESVFKLLESLDGMSITETIGPLQEYRETNKAEAMKTMPPEDRLIAEIECKSALGEIQ